MVDSSGTPPATPAPTGTRAAVGAIAETAEKPAVSPARPGPAKKAVAAKLWGAAKRLPVLIGYSSPVVLVAGFFVYAMRDQPTSKDFATPVFGASAALVALLLPAAGLAGPYAMARAFNWITLYLTAPDEDKKGGIEAAARSTLENLARSVTPLMFGFVFVTLSFPVSAVAVVGVTGKAFGQPREHVLVGTAVGLLVTAVLYFLPFTLRLLDRQLFVDALEKLFPPTS